MTSGELKLNSYTSEIVFTDPCSYWIENIYKKKKKKSPKILLKTKIMSNNRKRVDYQIIM